MAITTALCNSFKTEILGGVHDLDTDVIKLALIKDTPSGSYGSSTTNYSEVTGNSDEASGTNYTTGGAILGSATISLDSNTAIVDFANVTFSSSTISADGCLIYNSTQANRAIAVIDFGGTVSSATGDFVITFPAAGASTAIIRIV